ncbi:MAG: hypothetical protein HC902_01945 [Calothrix sp. SM1_5_4]|nr:hypothetical protein [Calothrix sp. SM1_5_4]
MKKLILLVLTSLSFQVSADSRRILEDTRVSQHLSCRSRRMAVWGGMLNSKSFGDHEVLWPVSGDVDVIRIFAKEAPIHSKSSTSVVKISCPDAW